MNKVKTVETHVRALIDAGHLAPGQFIDKWEIAKAMHVSRQPVDLALTFLAVEGLVEILPQRGTYVRRPESRPPHISQEAARELLSAAKEVWAWNDTQTMSGEPFDGLTRLKAAITKAEAQS